MIKNKPVDLVLNTENIEAVESHQNDNGYWYFWDETGDEVGPFPTEWVSRVNLLIYEQVML